VAIKHLLAKQDRRQWPDHECFQIREASRASIKQMNDLELVSRRIDKIVEPSARFRSRPTCWRLTGHRSRTGR